MEDHDLTAHMGSRGPWYNAQVRAVGVLGARAVANGLMRWDDVPGRLALAGLDAPSSREIRRWAADDPNLPEKLLEAGLLDVAQLPSWARTQINGRGEASMGQRTVAAMPEAKPSNAPSALRKVVIAAAVMWGIGKLLSGPGSPPRGYDPEAVRRMHRRLRARSTAR